MVFELVDRGEISLTDKFTVSEDAWRRGGFPSGTSTMGLAPRDTPTVEELLHGVIIMSGNDACIVLAEGISGSEEAFARRMTTLAHELGLNSANFQNATGLEAVGHVISAEDLAKPKLVKKKVLEGEKSCRLSWRLILVSTCRSTRTRVRRRSMN